MNRGNLSSFLIVLGIIVSIVLCAAWPRHDHDRVRTHWDVDGFTDSRRVCTEEMVPTLLPEQDPIAYTGVAVTELGGVYRVTGTVLSNDEGFQLSHGFACAVFLKDNTTWFARELRVF